MPAEGSRLTVIVGASQGIGRHLTTRALGRGDEVLACARSRAGLEALLRELGADAASLDLLAGDFLADSAELDIMAARIADHGGPVTVIVSAATIGAVGSLTQVDIDEWAQALITNVVGTARLISRVVPVLDDDDLVVVFSGGGVGGPNPQPNVSAYTTSKAALMHLVEVAARENPAGPVLVAIAPGAFPTGFTDPVVQADPQLAGPALLDDVGRTRAAAFDAGDLDALLDYLEAGGVAWLSGRSLSARRDGPDALRALAERDGAAADLFKLRRVDGAGIAIGSW